MKREATCFTSFKLALLMYVIHLLFISVGENSVRVEVISIHFMFYGDHCPVFHSHSLPTMVHPLPALPSLLVLFLSICLMTDESSQWHGFCLPAPSCCCLLLLLLRPAYLLLPRRCPLELHYDTWYILFWKYSVWPERLSWLFYSFYIHIHSALNLMLTWWLREEEAWCWCYSRHINISNASVCWHVMKPVWQRRLQSWAAPVSADREVGGGWLCLWLQYVWLSSCHFLISHISISFIRPCCIFTHLYCTPHLPILLMISILLPFVNTVR